MSAIWTLLYDGVEKTMAEWGIADDWTIAFVNKAKSTVTMRSTEPFDGGAAQFAFKGAGVVKMDGVSFFQGFFDDPQRTAIGGREYIQYQLHDVIWLFERHPFAQRRRQFNGWVVPGDPDSGPTTIDVVASEIFLGQTIEGDRATNGQQIAEVIDWVNECYNPTKRGATSGRDDAQDVVQAGAIDPQTEIPITRVNTVFCSECIISVLRWNPDAVIYVDHSTTPPTLNVRTMAKWDYETDPPTFLDYTNLPEIALTITEQQQRQIQLQSKQSRVLPGVIIYYLTSATVDTITVPVVQIDKFPADVTDYTPEAARHAIELSGSNVQHVTAQVKVASMSQIASGLAADAAAWWIAHDKSLQDPKIDAASVAVTTVEVVDESGTPVSLVDYPNELLSTIPQWARDAYTLHVVKATVKATVSFVRYRDDDHTTPDAKPDPKVVAHSLKLTNAEGITYTAIASSDSGETAPANVAESVYRSAAASQYAGAIEFVGVDVRTDIFVGCRVKLTGPSSVFSELLVQGVTHTPAKGITRVTYGPSAVLDADALIELARATRLRIIYNMPNSRSDGMGTGGGGDLDEGSDNSTDNTIHGVGGYKYSSESFQQP